jgi:hypothetical protein
MVELIDPKIFASNIKNVTEKRIGNTNTKIIIVDDFFRYPDKVRDYALSAKYSKESDLHDNPGYISRFIINPGQFIHHAGYLKETYFHDYRVYTIDLNPTVSFQCYDKIGPLPPHVDDVNYAGLVPLNTDEELSNASGTAFFRHKKTGQEFTCTDSYRAEETLNDWDMSQWDRYHIQYHKYNQLIFYESCVFHSAYWNQTSWTVGTPRLTFNTFTW